jgi:hypothetical protein
MSLSAEGPSLFLRVKHSLKIGVSLPANKLMFVFRDLNL